jgi:hypothetical protein
MVSDGQPAQCGSERLTFSPPFGLENLMPVPAVDSEPFAVASPVPINELTPLVDGPPTVVLLPVLPPWLPPPLAPPPEFGIPLTPGTGRNGAELSAIIEISGDKGGTGGNDRGV